MLSPEWGTGFYGIEKNDFFLPETTLGWETFINNKIPQYLYNPPCSLYGTCKLGCFLPLSYKKLPSPSRIDHRKIWQTHPFQKIPFSTLSESSSLIRGGRVFRFFLTNAYANQMKGRNDKWPMTCLKTSIRPVLSLRFVQAIWTD